MHALVLRIPFLTGYFRMESLAEELRSRGIPVIKNDIIAAHKREMQKGSRSGIYTILGPALSRIHHFMNFAFFMAESPASTYGILGIMSLLSVVLWIASPAIGLPAWPFAAFLAAEGIGLVLTIAMVIALMITQAKMSTAQRRTFRQASSFWMRLPVLAFDEATLSLTHGVPERLRDRTRRAALLRGAQVEIDVFTEDPLICVSRPRFLFLTERAYIGGWDTKNPQIENV